VLVHYLVGAAATGGHSGRALVASGSAKRRAAVTPVATPPPPRIGPRAPRFATLPARRPKRPPCPAQPGGTRPGGVVAPGGRACSLRSPPLPPRGVASRISSIAGRKRAAAENHPNTSPDVHVQCQSATCTWPYGPRWGVPPQTPQFRPSGEETALRDS